MIPQLSQFYTNVSHEKIQKLHAKILIHLSFLYILQMENGQHVERFANKHVDTVYQRKNRALDVG